MKRILLAAPAAIAALAIAAGCSGGGGGGGGGNSFTGTIKGTTFAPKSAVFVTTTVASNFSVTLTYITDTPDFCNEVLAGRIHQNAKIMAMFFGDLGTSAITPPTAPGTYTEISLSSGSGTPPPKIVAGTFSMLDTSCNSISASSANTTTGGSIDLTTVSASAFAGHGTLIWDSGDSTGIQLDAQPCPGLLTALQGTNGSCVP